MYGIEATLPKASGGTSNPVNTEVQRRVYSLNYRIKEYEQKIAEVQNRIPLVHEDREIEVLLEADSMWAIGKHIKLSSTTIIRTRDCIVNQMLMGGVMRPFLKFKASKKDMDLDFWCAN